MFLCFKLAPIVCSALIHSTLLSSWLLEQPLYIFNRENPQNSEPQNDPRSRLDYIALLCTDYLWFCIIPVNNLVLEKINSEKPNLYILIVYLETIPNAFAKRTERPLESDVGIRQKSNQVWAMIDEVYRRVDKKRNVQQRDFTEQGRHNREASEASGLPYFWLNFHFETS